MTKRPGDTKSSWLVFMGTRPEVIKLAPVVLEARRRKIPLRVVFTGQHAQLARPLFEFFGFAPDFDLDVMTPNQSLTSLSASLFAALDAHLGPDPRASLAIVQGDTTTAFACAYWAFTRRIAVAHVEAGLRTYDLAAPYPEEANRQLVSRIARYHFAPTREAERALRSERVPGEIFRVGNTGIDAVHLTLARLRRERLRVEREWGAELTAFARAPGPLVVVTAHRRESFGEPFARICAAIRELVERNPELRVVYPLHPNPNLKASVARFLEGHSRIWVGYPLNYLGFVALMNRASLILTDSGGVQEEAPSLKKPILVLRRTTERPEGIRRGFARLVGDDPAVIVREAERALARGFTGRGENPYGDGQAARRLVTVLAQASSAHARLVSPPKPASGSRRRSRRA